MAKKKKLDDNFYDKWDAYARKRYVWGRYVAEMNHQRLLEEERRYQKGDAQVRAEIEAARSNRIDMIYIG